MSQVLDELMASLDGLPEAERKALYERAAVATHGYKWLPSPGAQTRAYFCPADVLLYGGMGGGGKSDLGLGLAFTAHKRSLILRRKYANLSALTERAIEINGTRSGYNGSPPPLLRTEDGRYIQFAGNQHLGDEQDWQGHPFDFKCVGKGTPVLLADGTYCPIENISVGQYVETLEGPRRVTKKFPVRKDHAVRVEIFDASGELLCSQDQSLTHEVLTPDGWVCHGKFDEASPSSIYEPIEYCEADKLSELSFQPSLVLGQLGEYTRRYLRQALEGAAYLTDCLCRMAASVFLVPQRQDNVFAGSYASPQGQQQPRELFAPLEPFWHFRQLGAGLMKRRISGFHDGDAHSLLKSPDCQDDCWQGSHLYDERARQPLRLGFDGAAYLTCLLQPCDVELPTPIYSVNDGLGKTPKYTCHIDKYDHPYTKEKRQIALGQMTQHRSFKFSKIGVIDLYDIEVEEVNHYITAGGVINKNCFDEATQFLELQVRFHLGWLRTTDPSQRVRALLATNPPVDAEGDWIIGVFRPWLDITHSNPAKHGELRWYVTAPDGSDLEVDGPEPAQLPGSAGPSIPMSRTFIPASLKDNPYLINSGYQAKLDGLPEPIRSAVRDGNFMAARADADFQVIPTQWVINAEARWLQQQPEGIQMTAMAVDIAQGGSDRTVLAMRYGGYYLKPVAVNGSDTPDGSSVAALVVKHRRDNCPVIVDMGGGYGGDTLSRLKDNGIDCHRFNAANKSTSAAQDGSKLTFRNKRAEAWWRFREALNPDQEGGSKIAIPHDPDLRADLCAPTWSLGSSGILIESKDDIRKRLGRSTDKGDAVVMALSQGEIAVKKRQKAWTERPSTANLGYASLKRKPR